MHTTIIAEAGVNHNGSMTLAKQMVEKAKQAGADYVKFQTFVPEKLVSRFAQKAEYQKETTGAVESQLQMLQKLALTQENFIELQAYCKTEILLCLPACVICRKFRMQFPFWRKVEQGRLSCCIAIRNTRHPIRM